MTHVCALCDRVLPLGGILDGKGRRVHVWCRGVESQRIAEDARATARRIKTWGPARQTSTLPLEGARA